MHILFNISGSKGNQAMKFGEFIEYNVKNIFVEKSSTKLSILSILSNSKLSISLDQSWKVLNSLFLLYANLRAYRCCTPLAFT